MLASDLLQAWPQVQWQHRRLIVGVSGGADSVALLLALAEVARPGQLVVAHFNHQWRGGESDADQDFVNALCQHLTVTCQFGRASTDGPQSELHVNQCDDTPSVKSAMHAKEIKSQVIGLPDAVKSEEAAREARTSFFIRQAYEWGASYVVTGHTADDRTETLLHNLFRGSGLAGAASLRQFRKLDEDLVLVRPLITRTRENVLQYLSARQQTFCSDSSNRNEAYTRNFLRQQILPSLRCRYPEISANLLRFSELAEEALSDIEQLATAWRSRVGASLAHATTASLPADWRGSGYWIMPAAAASDQPWTVLRAALRQLWLERSWPMQELNRGHWESLHNTLLTAAQRSQLEAPSALRHHPEPQILLYLPGGVRVEAAASLLAIGRANS